MTETKGNINPIFTQLRKQESGAPLAVFRFVFGLLMFFSILRFWLKGWIEHLYIAPDFYFSYAYFDWVKPLGDPGMYFLFAGCGLFALGVALGAFYRFSTVGFFLTFTYIELIDKTNYLNHYYFVSIIAFLLIFIPAHRRFSVDIRLGRVKEAITVPALYRYLLIFQLSLVYFFAGFAKLNYDWLVRAQPLDIWLKAFGHWPLVGPLFDSVWLPYLFSWGGAIYDLSIPFFLLASRTRPIAYLAVLGFHLLTAILFPIGMFPYIMIGATLIFFPPRVHEKILGFSNQKGSLKPSVLRFPRKPSLYILAIFCAFQLIFPLRHLLYGGNLFWHEQGYRFGWRVMLMEKAGLAQFKVHSEELDRPIAVRNSDFLTDNQEKMMATQPDMIVQYAKHLESHYQKKGIVQPRITADVSVTLNGRESQQYIDPGINLAEQDNSWASKQFILPMRDEE